MEDKEAQCTAVTIDGGKLHAFDQEFATPDDLRQAIAASGAGLVEITVHGNPGFELIGQVIYAVARTGVKMKDLRTKPAPG